MIQYRRGGERGLCLGFEEALTRGPVDGYGSEGAEEVFLVDLDAELDGELGERGRVVRGLAWVNAGFCPVARRRRDTFDGGRDVEIV